MKLHFLLLVLVSNAVASDLRAFMWQESRDEKTRERQYGFFVASEAAKEAVEAEARGNGGQAAKLAAKLPADTWMYGILLHGDAKAYPKEKISIVRGHDLVEISSGHVIVDLKKRSIEIDLSVVTEGKSAPFLGNGTFEFTERPKK